MPLSAAQNIDSLTVLDRAKKRPLCFSRMRPEMVSTKSQIPKSISHATKNSLYVSYDKDLTEALVKHSVSIHPSLGAGLFNHALDPRWIPALNKIFQRIAFKTDERRESGFLPPEELAEVLQADNGKDLFIGGSVDTTTKTITLWRGNSLEPLTVPFSAFIPAGDGAQPDFSDFSVTDYGQTVRLGDYEAAVDAILYENDSDYRRRISKRRLQEEQTFGASIRRLRKQRGLRREEFEPTISAKTVARIEQGKQKQHQVRNKTLEALAERLQVEPEKLGTF